MPAVPFQRSERYLRSPGGYAARVLNRPEPGDLSPEPRGDFAH